MYLSAKQEVCTQLDLGGSSFVMLAGAMATTSKLRLRITADAILGLVFDKRCCLSLQLKHTKLPKRPDSLMENLTSLSVVQRQVASIVVVSWFKELRGGKNGLCN